MKERPSLHGRFVWASDWRMLTDVAKRISFVIPAHNEQQLLGRAVDSIHAAARAAGRDYEVIVVNDASTDRTAEVAAAHGARVVDVNLRQIGAVRNAGAAAASGDLLVFLDADTVLPARTLAAALRANEDGAIGGGAHVRFDGKTPLWACIPTLAFLITWFDILRWAAGCFIFARREAFEAIGGFDTRYFVAEEMYLSLAMKPRGRFVILRQPVFTSNRKMQLLRSPRYVLKSLSILRRGSAAFTQREGLEMWYDWQRPENAAR